ncbi:MAG: competence protein TfoX [Oscillospiraceae bacterium]|nr:competence protein TfoX [Oscillospiraceae bacterium]
MASTKNYLDFILGQLSDLDEISYRAMMGEYIIYYREKIIGGIYDDRFLVKPVKSAILLMPDATFEIPYGDAKEMILVDNVDDKHFLKELMNAMYDELPAPKKKK